MFERFWCLVGEHFFCLLLLLMLPVALYRTLHLTRRVGGGDTMHERNKVPFAQLVPESVK